MSSGFKAAAGIETYSLQQGRDTRKRTELREAPTYQKGPKHIDSETQKSNESKKQLIFW